METKNEDIGIIIGRFQTSKLHDGHSELIKQIKNKHPIVAIFLGISPLIHSKKNPLDFESRRQMINDAYPWIHVHSIPDNPLDTEWIKNLNFKITTTFPNKSIRLYGGRDSFLNVYNLDNPLFSSTILESGIYYSSSNVREEVRNYNLERNESFRNGVINAIQNQFSRIDVCIDVAIYNSKDEYLLAKKIPQDGDQYRFIGGFIDSKDTSPEDAVIREVKEETGVEVGLIELLQPHFINDWRYKNQSERLLSLFYKAQYESGQPQPNDDIDLLEWIHKDDLYNKLISEHKIFIPI